MTDFRSDINNLSGSLSSEPDCAALPPQIRVCHNTACKKAGSTQVLSRLQALNLPDIEVLSVGCLGACGQGPNVLVLPEQTWYHYVQVETVKAIAAQHFALQSVTANQANGAKDKVYMGGRDRSQLWAYLFLGLAILLAIGSCVLAIYQS
ncbi:MAG: (2Fe-2S) ferredoxin domain-containing protein [Cyanobacteria bacterium P01_H01_bin.58]